MGYNGFVVRTWNLHAIDQGVVVSLIHTTEYGVRSLSGSITLHGDTRNTLEHARHVDVRRELDALLAHHVEHVARIFTVSTVLRSLLYSR